MDIDRNKSGFQTGIPSGPGLENCVPGKPVGTQQVQHSGIRLATEEGVMPSIIPEHSLPQAVPKSTTPTLLPSQTITAPIGQETVTLANHVSLQIFSSALTQHTKNVMLFLHGGPGLEYDDDYESVTKWFVGNGYTVVAPEIAGSGTTGLENTSNSYSQNYVQDLKSVIHYLRERPEMQGKEFCVVAHSWGGFQLASLLTDETAEERGFFKQAAFISPNLDSAQTRLFADASEYNDASDGSLLAFGRTLVRNFEERHTGNEEKMDESGKMTALNNPLIDQSLNEKFSPFYRLDKIPKELPCLFFHATDDEQVPSSLSVDAFAKVNNAGGNASIVISSKGGHRFFITGDTHQPGVTTNCFAAINTLVKQGGSSNNVVIDGDTLADSDIEAVEKRLLVADKAYENHTRALENFHNEIETPANGNGRKRIPPKRELLEKIATAHENLAKKFEMQGTPVARRNAESNRNSANLINKSLEKT